MNRDPAGGVLGGRVAVVTGGSGGIGQAICRDLARRGACVALTYRKHDRAALALVEQIAMHGGQALAVPADVARHDDVKALIEQVLDTLGGLHILVNNAGIAHDALIYNMSPDSWFDVMRVNFGGVFNCTQLVLEHFMAQRSGVIVNISSPLADRAWVGTAAYAASKAAVNAFTRSCALEFGRFGVRVNAVAPGFVPTELTSSATGSSRGTRMLSKIPLRACATPEDIAKVVGFLASDDAAYMTGSVVVVDGGGSAVMGSGSASG